MNPPTQVSILRDLSKEYFVMDDDASCTSSTMSDEASWASHRDDDDDDGDDMDISQVYALPSRGNESSRSIDEMQGSARIVPSRSTVSLSALAVHKQRSFRLAPPSKQLVLSKHASVANFSSSCHGIKAVQTVSAQACSPGDISPNEYLCKLLDTKLDRVPCNSLGDYFLKTTPEHIAAWDGDLLRAVRTQNLDLIQDMHKNQGKPLQACNQFGESILHVCVRRGTPEILHYLLGEGGVSPRVHCENGRTPLHDAFWTFAEEERSIKMTALLLKQCPEMLLITDKRGFTPLHYVPRSQWEACYKFLNRCLPLLMKLKNNGRPSAAA